MTSLDEVRQAVVGAFQAIHEVHYPSTKVNYPDFDVVDLENQEQPFVNLELDFSAVSQAAMGENELEVPCMFLVTFYYRPGRGSAEALKYTDMLNEYLCMSQIEYIYYGPAVPIPVTTFPGWQGSMNTIKFHLTSFVPCQI